MTGNQITKITPSSYRGEYIQVIDANQDNYIEECLKIRSILSEFEEMDLESSIPYIPGIEYEEPPAPIAILGAREHYLQTLAYLEILPPVRNKLLVHFSPVP